MSEAPYKRSLLSIFGKKIKLNFVSKKSVRQIAIFFPIEKPTNFFLKNIIFECHYFSSK